eukprot:1159594-Pelagomonas_calceolata.AAC.2
MQRWLSKQRISTGRKHTQSFKSVCLCTAFTNASKGFKGCLNIKMDFAHTPYSNKFSIHSTVINSGHYTWDCQVEARGGWCPPEGVQNLH